MMTSDNHFVAPPTYTTHESMELNELSRLNDWEADYRQLKSGAFEAHFDLYASSNVRFTEQYCSREMIAVGVPPPDHVAFMLPLMPQDNGRCQGSDLGSNDVVLIGENQEIVYRTPDDFRFIMITTPLSGLNSYLSALTDESSERFTNSNRVISMPERLKADLVTSVRRIRQAAQGEESQGIGSPCLLEAEDALNAILGQGLTLPQTVDSGARGRRNRLRYLMQAREFIAENLNRKLSVQRILILKPIDHLVPTGIERQEGKADIVVLTTHTAGIIYRQVALPQKS